MDQEFHRLCPVAMIVCKISRSFVAQVCCVSLHDEPALAGTNEELPQHQDKITPAVHFFKCRRARN